MNKTGIDYCDFTWNPTHGCSFVSDGCTNCWAEGMAKRLSAMGVKGYDPGDPFKVVCMPDKLNEPLKRKKPAIIAVSFMGDLFHPDVPVEFIDKVFGVMALAKQHRFIVLTKRAERMHDYLTGLRDDPKQAWRFEKQSEVAGKFHKAAMLFRRGGSLPNVIGMVTAENQKTADERSSWLMRTPFAMRGLSLEPLLEEIDLTNILAGTPVLGKEGYSYGMRRLNWIIVGGESGHNPRYMDPTWARNLRDQCKASGTAYFMKQMSGRTPAERHAIPTDLMVQEFPEGMKL